MRRFVMCLMLCAMAVACDKDEKIAGEFKVAFGEFECETTETTATVTTLRPVAVSGDMAVAVEDVDLSLAYGEVESAERISITTFETVGDSVRFNIEGLKPETTYAATLCYNGGEHGVFNSEATTFTTLASAEPEPDPEPDPDPDPLPDAVELPYLSGLYFGNAYGATDNDYNYSVALATQPNCFDIITGDALIGDNSQYLFLDLYASEPAEEYNVRFTLPAGTYTVDMRDTAVAGTIGVKYSSLYTTNDTAGEEVFFKSGTVTVTSSIINAQLVAEDGTEYCFTCPTTTVDNSQHFGPTFAPDEQSTLEGDLEIPYGNATIATECYGDYYVVGKSNWMLYVNDNDTGDTLTFELLAELDATLPKGRFPVTNDLNERQMALPGYVYGSEIMWSWYCFYNADMVVTSSAPIVGGEVSVTDNGDGTLSVVVDVVDDMGHKITGECTSQHVSLSSRATMPTRKHLTR